MPGSMPSPGGALPCHLRVGGQLCPDTGSEGGAAAPEPGVHPALAKGLPGRCRAVVPGQSLEEEA